MIRVLHVVSNMGCGGVQQMLMNYGRRMSDVRFDFLLTKPGMHDAEIERAGGRVFYAPGFERPADYLRVTARLLASHPEYGIIQGHNGMLQALALGAAKRAGTPVRIAHAHATAIPMDAHRMLKRPLRPLVRRFSTHRWACCERAGVFFFGEKAWRGGGMLVCNAIETDRFAFDPVKRRMMRVRLGWTDELVIGHVGRLCYEKNQARLLSIFAHIHRERPDARLVLVGEGGDEPALRARAARLGIAEAVHFAGLQRDMPGWYSLMDVLVMPSRAEGLPLTAVEAQASGLPCLLSEGITQETALTQNVRFLPLEADDARWAAEALRLARAPRMDGSRAVAKAGYDIEREAARLEGIYARLDGQASCARRKRP